jgi:hypothetical protein
MGACVYAYQGNGMDLLAFPPLVTLARAVRDEIVFTFEPLSTFDTVVPPQSR